MAHVVFEQLEGASGYYDHTAGVILVDKGQCRRGAASTIVHELVHSIVGDIRRECETRAEENRRELAADRLAARVRIPFGALVEAFTRCPSRAAMLVYLHCDEDELMARLLGLTDEERFLFEICARRCIGFGSKQARRGYPASIESRRLELMMGA